MAKIHNPIYKGSLCDFPLFYKFYIASSQLEMEKEKKRGISASKLTNCLGISNVP